MSRTLIIDSRNRASGESPSNFILNMTPPLYNVRNVNLAYASIPVIEELINYIGVFPFLNLDYIRGDLMETHQNVRSQFLLRAAVVIVRFSIL